MSSKMYIGSSEIAKLNDVYTKTQADTLLGNKQNTLVSGTSIKTINNQSILGSGNIECVTDYKDLTNKPIIPIATGTEFVEGDYYIKQKGTTTNLALNDNISKIEFDTSKYPNFASIKDDTWVDMGDADVKYLAILEKTGGKLYVCAFNWEESNGLQANAIIITNTNILGDEDTQDYINIYTAYFSNNKKISGGWGTEGEITGVSFNASTGVLTLDTTYEIITMNHSSTLKSFAFEEFGGNADICKYIGGQLFKLITNNEIELDVDATPTENSFNPILSGGVYEALQDKQDKLTNEMDTGTLNMGLGFTSNGQLVQGVISATKKLYRHDVTITLANNNGFVCLMILNDSNTAINTANALDSYLYGNGYTSGNGYIQCSGVVYTGVAEECVYALTRSNSQQFAVEYYTGTAQGVTSSVFGYSQATISDHIIEL